MLKRIISAIFLTLLLSACGKHGKMLQRLEELDAMGDNYEAFPNDTAALDVVAYMERCGSLEERQRAWKMLAKVYRRKGLSFNEESAWSMAVGCVDTTKAFDTLSFAQTIFDWSHCLERTLDHEQSRSQVIRAVDYALAAGDTLMAMRYYGDINSDSAYHYLWSRGEKSLAMDASVSYIEHLIDIHTLDSASVMLDRYAKYTHYNLESPYSYEANHYWMMRGKQNMVAERYDSAIYYFQKVLQMDSLRWEEAGRAKDEIAECYKRMGQPDSAHYYLMKTVEASEFIAYRLVHDRFLSRFRDYQIQHDNLDMRDEAELMHLWMLSGLFVFVGAIVFGIYRYNMLRIQHKDTLQQNREYADMLESLRHQQDNTMLNADIAHRFHELSSQDAHPTEAEWNELLRVVNEKHPHLFENLSKNHELSLQEQRIISLITIKCTPLQMSVLLVCTKSNISNLRRRLYQRITGNEGNGADLDKLVYSMLLP